MVIIGLMNSKKINKIIIFLFSLLLSSSIMSLNSAVKAQFALCDFFPCTEAQESSPDFEAEVYSTTESLALLATGSIFLLILIYGVYLVLKGTLRMIRADGQSDRFVAGYSLIRTFFLGLGLLFVGLIGLVVMSVLFDITGIFTQDVTDPTGTLPFVS